MAHIQRCLRAVALLLTAILLPETLACDGYGLVIKKVEPCNKDGENVVKMTDLDLSLKVIEGHCHIMIKGCVETTKDFKDAKVTYDIKGEKKYLQFKGTKDMCKELKGADAETIKKIKSMNMPSECPVKKGKLCSKPGQSMDIDKMKGNFRYAKGKWDATFNVEHDSGKTCYKVNMELKKATKSGK